MNTGTSKNTRATTESPAEDWHPSFVIAALHQAGWTLSSLAEHHNLKSGGTLSKALRFSFPVAELRIADALNKHPKEIWPTRYHENGERKLQGFHAIQSTRRRNSVNAQNSARNIREDT